MTEADASQAAPRQEPLLVVLTGPSGAGKDAVLDELASRGRRFYRVITATTRTPRENERDGVDYFFLSDMAFDQLIDTGGLLEWARIYGHRSGVPKQQVLDRLEEGLDVYVRTDVQGADSIKRLMPHAVRIFIAPSSIDELEERIRARGSDSEDRIAKRMAAAREEMARQHEFEHVIINYPGRLSDTADQLESILDAERNARVS